MNKNTTNLDQKQLHFSFNKSLTADFEGGEISSDGGLLLLREFDKKTAFLQGLNNCIRDPRNEFLIVHEQEEMLRQRLFQIALGYEDADDSDLLRLDPLFQITVKNRKLVDELASQPTICRLENRVAQQEIDFINNFLLNNYLKSRSKKPKQIIIDVDSTDDPTHGAQQLSMFHGYYGQTIYHPLLISEPDSQLLLGAFLRPGNVHTAHDALKYLAPVAKELKANFPKANLIIRADAGFSAPETHQFCEKENLEYVIGIASNNNLHKAIEAKLARAKARLKGKDEAVYLHASFKYRAESWVKQRRVIAKLEVTTDKEEIRFVVTNLKGKAKDIYEFYCQRGDSENRIKEVKHGFKADRLSCHDFLANYFRLLLSSCAYNFIALFKNNLTKENLRDCQIQTIRLKLFKVGVWIKKTTRKVWAHLSSAWPFQALFRQAYWAIRAAPAYSLA